MLCISTDAGIAQMEVDNDHSLIRTPDDDTLNKPDEPLIVAWNISMQKLSPEPPIKTSIRVVKHVDADQHGLVDPTQPSANSNPNKLVLQHAGLKITRVSGGSIFIKVSNLKVIQKILADQDLTDCSPTQVPYTTNTDLTKTREGEYLKEKSPYQSGVGTIRFVADATHCSAACITRIIGRHLYNPPPKKAPQ